MRKIKILDKKVAELIAAGEIIERPASVVKELVENSIDSGASKITVEIKYGGIKYIKVVDDGCGISRDDIENAFLSHATSKISTEDDLENIHTLGFRGEALASIAAVSRIKLKTFAEGEKIGSCYQINFTESRSLADCGHPHGSAFEIYDLFFNTPARMKFLKSCAKEGQNVGSLVEKMAISHPEISFKFLRDGKNIFTTPGDGDLKSAVFTVFGKAFFDNLIPIKYEYEYLKIKGFVGTPESGKPNRSSQYFFINGRYIRTKIGSAALDQAYQEEIFHGKFPIAVIHIEISPKVLDVNVHPSKTEIKFFDEKIIFNAIFYAAKSAIENHKREIFPMAIDNITDAANAVKIEKNYLDSSNIFEENNDTLTNTKILHFSDKNNFSLPPETEIVSNNEKNAVQIEQKIIYNDKKINHFDNKALSDIDKNNSICQEKLNDFKQQNKIKILGEVFETYIIGQLGNKMIMIDKHAAHERLIFEKIKNSTNFSSNDSQILADPIAVNLTSDEHFSILTKKEYLQKIGFSIEDFGNNMILVRSAPTYLEYNKISDEIIEIAGYIAENKNNLETNFVQWLQKNIACRNAIKAGSSSEYTEILSLVEKLYENPEIIHCPHGRPIYVTLDINFFKRQFFRT